MEFIFHNLYFTFWFAVSDSDFLQSRYLPSTKQLSQGFKKIFVRYQHIVSVTCVHMTEDGIGN